MAVGAALALGGTAAVGAVSGAISGAQGTPDQVKRETGTRQTTFDPASQREQELQDSSLRNYLRQQMLAQQYEEGIGGRQGIQDASQQQIQNIIGGQAFNITPQEQARIDAIRQASVAQSQADTERFINDRLQQVQGQAANRGLRGQALTSLQGGAIRTGVEQLGQAQRQADLLAAQQSYNAPFARLQAQQPYLSQGATFADQMRLQAQQNRQNAQNPFLLELLNRERIAGGKTTQTGESVTPGQEGSFWNALTGGLAGAAGAAKSGIDVAKGGKDLGIF